MIGNVGDTCIRIKSHVFLDKTVLTAVTVNRGLYVSTWSNYEYRYTTIYCSDLDYILKFTINEVVQIEFFYVSPWKIRIKCFICLALFLQRFVFLLCLHINLLIFFYFGNTWVKDIVYSTLSNSILWSTGWFIYVDNFRDKKKFSFKQINYFFV